MVPVKRDMLCEIQEEEGAFIVQSSVKACTLVCGLAS